MDDLYELNVAYATIMAKAHLCGMIVREDLTALEDIGTRLVQIAEAERREWRAKTPFED